MIRTFPLSTIRSFSLYTQQISIWRIPVLCVQWKTADDGQRNCPKHVEFYSKNKFEKLAHLVGFVISIYDDARSRERQIIGKFYSFFNFGAKLIWAVKVTPSALYSLGKLHSYQRTAERLALEALLDVSRKSLTQGHSNTKPFSQ